LGNEIIVKRSEIIAIINLLNTKNNSNKNFIETAHVEGKIEKVTSKEIMKSFIITDKRVYLSNISSAILYRRAKTRKI